MQRKLISIPLVLMLVTVAVWASQNFVFNLPYSNSEFSATFPTPDDKAGVHTSVHEGKGSPDKSAYTNHLYEVSTSGDSAAFFVAYADYASQVDTSVAALDRIADASFHGAGVTLVPGSRKDSTLAGMFAREAKGVSDEYEMYIRTSFAGTRAWEAFVIFKKSLHATQADADEFLNSIRRPVQAR